MAMHVMLKVRGNIQRHMFYHGCNNTNAVNLTFTLIIVTLTFTP